MYDIQFQKQKGWYTPSEEFVKEWEEYGLTEDDYFHVREDFPDYWEYHWMWEEPKVGGRLFRKSYTQPIPALRCMNVTEFTILKRLEEQFIQEINKYYFHASRPE